MKITVKDFMYIQELLKNVQSTEEMHKHLLKYFNLLNLKPEDADAKMTEIYTLLNEFNEMVLHEDKFKLIQRFEIDGIEYGLIPKFDDMTVGEWIDIDAYQSELTHINKLLSIFYRPIVDMVGDKYKIEEYDGTKYSNEMLNADVQVYFGLMVFFYTLNKELIEGTSIYIQSETNQMKKIQKDS
jgi:hypothetical protein